MAKIIIIDDNLQVCKILVKRFTKADHMVSYSLTLKQGLEKLFSDEFDILFLDV